MQRIPWDRHRAEFEELTGLLLTAKYPLSATRVRPHRGDKGIDVYLDTDRGWVVFQMKAFTGLSVTDDQWRQIERSWATFVAYVDEVGLAVAGWHVVRPQQPSIGEIERLAELTKDAPFPCSWRHLDFCDALAAECPAMVDYMIGGGKAAADAAAARLISVLGLVRRDESEPSGDLPRDIQAVLGDIHEELQRTDPFYGYDFAVTGVRGGLPARLPAEHAAPGLVASVTSSDSSRAITVRIVAKTRDATLERPILGNVVPSPAPNSGDEAAWRDFLDFGIPITGAGAKVTLDLPGGLGVDESDVTLTIGPPQVEPDQDQTMRILSPDGEVVAAAELQTKYVTQGITGRGKAVLAAESGGCFDVRIKLTPDGSVRFDLDATDDLTGMRPAAAVAGLRVLASMRPPNRVQLAFKDGIDIGAPFTIEQDYPGADAASAVADACEDLATIQRHTQHPIRIPNLDQWWEEEVEQWEQVSHLIRTREVRSVWSSLPIVRTDQAESEMNTDEEFSMVVDGDQSVSVGGVRVHVGRFRKVFPTARHDPDFDGPADRSRLVPGADDTCITYWGP